MASWRAALLLALLVVIFGLTLFVVSARIWLPTDMLEPGHISEVSQDGDKLSPWVMLNG